MSEAPQAPVVRSHLLVALGSACGGEQPGSGQSYTKKKEKNGNLMVTSTYTTWIVTNHPDFALQTVSFYPNPRLHDGIKDVTFAEKSTAFGTGAFQQISFIIWYVSKLTLEHQNCSWLQKSRANPELTLVWYSLSSVKSACTCNWPVRESCLFLLVSPRWDRWRHDEKTWWHRCCYNSLGANDQMAPLSL